MQHAYFITRPDLTHNLVYIRDVSLDPVYIWRRVTQ